MQQPLTRHYVLPLLSALWILSALLVLPNKLWVEAPSADYAVEVPVNSESPTDQTSLSPRFEIQDCTVVYSLPTHGETRLQYTHYAIQLYEYFPERSKINHYFAVVSFQYFISQMKEPV